MIGVVLSVSLAILVITAGLFFFLPRTARAAFQHLVSHRYHLVGFSNHVMLGEIGEVKQENVPVMHVKMDHPEDRSLALKWRGAALSEFNGRAWFNRPVSGQILQPDRGGLMRLDDEAPDDGNGRYISYAVYLNDLAQDALFFAGTPQYMRIDSLVVRRPFGNYSAQFSDSRTVSYQVYSRLETPSTRSVTKVEPLARGGARTPICNCRALDPRIQASWPKISSAAKRRPLRQAQLLRNYLSTHYGYTLELPPVEPDDPLAFFLFHRKKGHCEYFASSMAVMLRDASDSFARGDRLPERSLQSDQRFATDTQLPTRIVGWRRGCPIAAGRRSIPPRPIRRPSGSRPGRGSAFTPMPSTCSGRTGC